MADYTEQHQSKIKALFVAANSTKTDPRKLDEEIRAITEKIRAAEHRDLLELVPILAARPDDLLQSFNTHKPQIVHFSGHGSPTGEIMLIDNNGLPKAVSAKAIKALFTILKDNVRLVILNAHYTWTQAEAITEVIDSAIGMNKKIGDQAAITFAASFYRAISFGRSVQEAFDQGKTALLLEGIPEADTPELLVKAGVNPSQLLLISPSSAFVREGQALLKRGQDALSRGDYPLAKRQIEKAVGILNEQEQSKTVAKANYLLTLIELNGKRPFVQTLPKMRSIENLMNSAIDLHHCYSYLVTLAVFKFDFARNGLTSYKKDANELILQAKQVAPTSEDAENIRLLSRCQPDLVKDYLTL